MNACACMYRECAEARACLAQHPEMRYAAEPLPVYWREPQMLPTQQTKKAKLSNCVLAALAAWLRHPVDTRIHLVRNRARRLHVIWERGGSRFEFYAPGRSSKTYLQNALYVGRVKEVQR